MKDAANYVRKWAWMEEYVEILEEVKWTKARDAAIEYSRACAEAFADVLTRFDDGYLPPIPSTLPLNNRASREASDKYKKHRAE